jgi:NADH-quinone oxidoreductase subunit F
MIASIDDKDRIFTNIYGFQDWGVEGAMKRGDWDNTKDLMIRGQDQIIEDIRRRACAGAVAPASRPA